MNFPSPEDFNLSDKFILDACCGAKYMWDDKNHPNAIYIDNRKGKEKITNRGEININPNIVMDFRKMEFPNNRFKLVVFDPPHMFCGHTGNFGKTYGSLNKDTWQEDIKKGFNECWRVLENYGILIFKWNEYNISYKEVLAIINKEPLFKQTMSGAGKSKTYWFCFMKIPKLVGEKLR